MLNSLWAALIACFLAGAPNIEYNAGVCLNDAGAGVLTYSSVSEIDPTHNYISYAYTGARPGETVYTITVYDTPADIADDNYILIVDCTAAGIVSVR